MRAARARSRVVVSLTPFDTNSFKADALILALVASAVMAPHILRVNAHSQH
jgi:hypothetical protein